MSPEHLSYPWVGKGEIDDIRLTMYMYIDMILSPCVESTHISPENINWKCVKDVLQFAMVARETDGDLSTAFSQSKLY